MEYDPSPVYRGLRGAEQNWRIAPTLPPPAVYAQNPVIVTGPLSAARDAGRARCSTALVSTRRAYPPGRDDGTYPPCPGRGDDRDRSTAAGGGYEAVDDHGSNFHPPARERRPDRIRAGLPTPLVSARLGHDGRQAGRASRAQAGHLPPPWRAPPRRPLPGSGCQSTGATER